ncbi:hypothetical protein [Azospirillum lipoferum]|uniref:Glycosyltransferase RgtA/B/C/D-like domain-containing protein n=1 Tax=Azospirillum lipoferum (strain 4B) TaxID=862719 RepID=G7ZJ69_AZOL4|nr:hypothetical protein [Azospirillum lipoferum]CBS91646.1 membrane protein of unknown function [Azospirillum lipoferum 4B]
MSFDSLDRPLPQAHESGTRGGADRPAAARTAGRASSFARILVRLLLALGALVVVYQFGRNMQASSGLPYWDDWGYFFGTAQGVQQPLTFQSIFAKDSDHVAPFFKLLTHGLWHAIGVDFIAFRLVGWLAFAAMLAAYAQVLLRDCVRSAWDAVPVAATGLFLTGTLNNEYFYYQHMGLAQPIFFTCLFLFLHTLARGRLVPATLFLLAFGSTGVFGASYALGAAGVGAVLALHQGGSWRTRLAKGRTLVAVGGGLLLTIAMLWMTFHGSYANHTGQPLVLPWHREFWAFLFGAFATAAGLPVETVGAPPSLAVGAVAFMLCLIPAVLLPFSRAGVERRHAVFCIASLIAGTVIVTMTTALGRAGLCGDGIAAAMRCGTIPRYAYPVLLTFPAAVAGWAVLMAGRAGAGMGNGTARMDRGSATGLILAALLVLGHSVGGSLLRHWEVAGFNRMVEERDSEAQRCIASHLQAIGTPGGLDWQQPLVCPSSSPRNIAPFLHAAYDLKADFLAPILNDAANQPERPILQSLLRNGTLDDATGALRLGMAVRPAGTNDGVNGSLDRIERIPNGPLALAGWAADMTVPAPAAFVLAAVGDRIVATGSTGSARPDVVNAFHEKRLLNSGFILPLPAEVAGQRVRLFVMAHSGALKELTPPGGVVVP